MKTKILFISILFILISGIYFVKQTSSRYISNTNVSGNATLAIPYFSMELQNTSPRKYGTWRYSKL